MSYKYRYDDDEQNIFEIPELKGKKGSVHNMNSLYEIVGYPEPELDEDEVEEYMEENECDEDTAVKNLTDNAYDEMCETAPTVTIESIKDENGNIDYFCVVIESEEGYEQLYTKDIEIMYKYIMSFFK